MTRTQFEIFDIVLIIMNLLFLILVFNKLLSMEYGQPIVLNTMCLVSSKF